MLRYLATQYIAAIYEGPKDNLGAFAVVAAFWAQIQGRYVGFLESTPLFIVFVLWAADFSLGSLIALRNSYRAISGNATPEELAGRWCPSRVAWAVGRFASWFILLASTHAIRQAGATASAISTAVESAVALSEASSLIRNYGVLVGAPWASAFARVADAAAARLPSVAEVTLGNLLPEPARNGKIEEAS